MAMASTSRLHREGEGSIPSFSKIICGISVALTRLASNQASWVEVPYIAPWVSWAMVVRSAVDGVLYRLVGSNPI